jgi:hypothetical protein
MCFGGRASSDDRRPDAVLVTARTGEKPRSVGATAARTGRNKMRSLRIVAPVALGVAALIGVAVTPNLMPESSAHAAVSHEAPVAHAAGSDAVAAFPSIVNVRLVRAEAALERVTTAVDQGQETVRPARSD